MEESPHRHTCSRCKRRYRCHVERRRRCPHLRPLASKYRFCWRCSVGCTEWIEAQEAKAV